MPEIAERLRTALANRYRIERELGAGGMATVYLAEDLKHQRKVAIKVLRPELAAVLGAERFVQEITTTAQLQHPHILPLFDSGQTDGFLYYVMPYIEGETLRERLNRETQLGIDEAVRIAVEVADALQYAHTQGVIHRDIKPENILLHGGRPMVADFGIALAVSAAAGGRMTETGMSLGTPHYMSPEQATAEKDITARSDVYSLASVLYEMLAGQPPHLGGSAQQIIMRIIADAPRPVTELRKSVPPNVAAAVAKALERLPADRFDSAKAFGEALQNPAFASVAPPGTVVAPHGRPVTWRQRLRDPFVLGPSVVAVAAIAVALGITSGRGADTAASLPPIRFVVAATDSTRPADNFPWPAAISPDGSMVVYSVGLSTGNTIGVPTENSMLYVLRTDQLTARPIPGTTGAYQPYFSPDGAWIAFEAAGKERKVRLDGSAPVTITDASSANGADWTVGDQIVLGSLGRFLGLSVVSAAGGEPTALTEPDTTNGDRNHLWPIALPDGKTIVFTIWSGSLASARLAMTSLADGRVTPLGIDGIRPLAVLDGMLVYVQADGAVMAVAVDARRRAVTGRPIPVHDPVRVNGANNGNSGIFISRGGAMVTSQGEGRGRLAWFRSAASAEPVLPDVRVLSYPRLSPDERRIAVLVLQDRGSDVWIFDGTLGTFSRLTSAGTVTSAEWTADGSRIVFGTKGEEVWSQLASGGSPAERLFATPSLIPTAAMSPDGRWLLVSAYRETWDVLRVPLDSERIAQPYLTTDATELAPCFSPDGKWVAVVTNESGTDEVVVRSFPEPTSRIPISVAGGAEPVWSRDGRRLYYRAGSAIIAAHVSLEPTFRLLGRDTVLVNAALVAGFSTFSPSYDVAADGRRVLGILPVRDEFRLVVAPNWITEFRERVAESRRRPQP